MAHLPAWAVACAAVAVRCLVLPIATRAPLGEGLILLDAAGNIAAGKGLVLSDSLLRIPPDAPPLLRRTLEHWRQVGGIWGVVPAGRPTAFLPPLYPLLLSAFVRLPSGLLLARFAGIAIGSLGVSMTYAIARRWCPSRAWLVALLAVTDPLASFQAAEISTHCLAATTALLPVWILSRSTTNLASLVAGLGCGLAFLARPTAWLLVPFLAPPLWRRGRLHVLLMTGAAALTVIPWVVRNWHDLGTPLLFTTNGGRNLWEFNNQKLGPEYAWSEPAVSRGLYDPIRRRHGPTLRRVDLLPFPVFAHETEIERDKILTRRFLGFARANPSVYLALVGVRTGQILSPWPLHGPPWVRGAFASYYVPFLVLAFTGAWAAVRTGGLVRAVALFVVSFVALHALTAAGFVYRGMIAPFLALLAGVGTRPFAFFPGHVTGETRAGGSRTGDGVPLGTTS